MLQLNANRTSRMHIAALAAQCSMFGNEVEVYCEACGQAGEASTRSDDALKRIQDYTAAQATHLTSRHMVACGECNSDIITLREVGAEAH